MVKIKKASFVDMWELEGRSASITLSTELSGSLGVCKMVIFLFIVQFLGFNPPKQPKKQGEIVQKFISSRAGPIKEYGNKAG